VARIMYEEFGAIYRTVVLTSRGDASYHTIYGPYNSRHTAASVGGNMVADKKRWGIDASYIVEETQTQWNRVDD
jgi:hypothetical protein